MNVLDINTIIRKKYLRLVDFSYAFCYDFIKSTLGEKMDIASLNQNFYELSQNFNLGDDNILRKFIHGITTADNCFAIANALHMSKAEREFVYACGLLHDVGRMEQWKQFGSFSDSASRPHEKMSVEFLSKGWIQRFFEKEEEQNFALKLIEHHTMPYQGADSKMKRYVCILRNGDNYANLQYTATGLQRLWVNEDGVTDVVLDKFQKRINLHQTPITTKLDRVFQFLSRTYAVDYPMLKRDLLGRKYINAIYDVYGEFLNKEDRKLLYQKCWNLKKELAKQVMDYEKAKQRAIKLAEQ